MKQLLCICGEKKVQASFYVRFLNSLRIFIILLFQECSSSFCPLCSKPGKDYDGLFFLEDGPSQRAESDSVLCQQLFVPKWLPVPPLLQSQLLNYKLSLLDIFFNLLFLVVIFKCFLINILLNKYWFRYNQLIIYQMRIFILFR